MIETIIGVVIALVVGAVVGFIISRAVLSNAAKNAKNNAETLVSDAKRQADTIKKEAQLEAKDVAYQAKQEAEREANEQRKELRGIENRLNQREDNLDKRAGSLDTREHQLSSLQGQVEKDRRDLEDAQKETQKRLEQVARMNTDEAKAALLDSVRGDVVHEEAAIIREAEQRAQSEAAKKSREILTTTIQRVAADHTAERTVTSVSIPSEDVKGRIIGREGRNIRTFEQITGVNLIVDDTPDTVVISGFDPVRREIGRVTLENLIADGRIHPARIEEMYNKANDLVWQQVQDAGEEAAFDTGIHDLHPELVKTLGRLKYRTSYGQNVLKHSLEVAWLAGTMASELDLDPAPAKRAGLLHDLGKAIDHETEGPHALIGAELAKRLGEKPEIVHAIEAHHADVEPKTVLAVIIQAADAISAARPGARRESAENYIKRLEKLEEIANSHDGVEKTYAMQAGREVRVMVEPEKINDDGAVVLAHDIAHEIEDSMEYPGQVKVVVIRESRATDIAK